MRRSGVRVTLPAPFSRSVLYLATWIRGASIKYLRYALGEILLVVIGILIADYYDDMLYYRTALNILTLMYRRQLALAEPLSAIIQAQ